MRIGIVTEYDSPTLGGIQEHVHHFARAARRVGHDVRILTPAVRDRLASEREVLSVDAARRADDENGVIRIFVRR
jgi:phosphatidylinositol alpha-mannosyltransferase